MQRKLRIIAVGKIRHGWIQEGIQTYWKRCPGLTIAEIKDSTREKECAEIQGMVKSRERLIVLSERGTFMNSVQFAQWLERETREASLVFAISGPEGMSPKLEAIAHQTIALSPMTFTHDMARLLLVEQLYRAQSILQNGNYHK